MVMITHTHIQKLKFKRSVVSKDRVETNGRTDGRTDATACFTFLASAVGNKRTTTHQQLQYLSRPSMAAAPPSSILVMKML